MRIATAVLFAVGLGALPLSAAKAQYACSYPLSWPFCIAGAAVNTAATIATAPFYALSGRPYYYYPYYHYNGSPYYYYGARASYHPLPRGSYRQPPAASLDDLQAARLACDSAHPVRIGNYLPHADCVNAAVERYAIGTSRYPDLMQLQEQLRSVISERIDHRAISPRAGEEQMAAGDMVIGAAERERDAVHTEAADQQIAQLEAMLNAPAPSHAPD